MLKIFLLAGGTNNEDFRFTLRVTKQKLETALLTIGHKEKADANSYMIEQKLTYKDICEQAEDRYRLLFDRNEWPPALNPRDSKAPPSAFGNVAEDKNTPLTRADIMAHIQKTPSNFSNQTKKPGNCI